MKLEQAYLVKTIYHIAAISFIQENILLAIRPVSTRKPNSYKRIRCSLPEIILLNRAPLTDKQKGEHTKTRNYIRRETSFEKYVSLESVSTVHERSLLRKIYLSLLQQGNAIFTVHFAFSCNYSR